MKNFAIKLDADMTAFLRAQAEKRGVSIEEHMDKLVQECIRQAIEYENARRKMMEILAHPVGGEFEDGRRPTREELYDRGRFR